MLHSFRAIGTCALLLWLAACSGSIDLGGGGDAPGGDTVVPDGPRGICDDGEANKPGPRLLRRLTGAEMTNAVRDAFALSAADWAGSTLPADPAGRSGFTNNADRLLVDEGYARELLAQGKAVAEVVTQPARLATLLPCAQAGGADCARQYLDTYGRRLYRRPLTDEERGRYLTLFDKVGGEGFDRWVYWATVAMLQSPHMVYRAELGEADGEGYKLTGYELATALAFDLTGHPPDDALLDQAASGALDTLAGVQAAARALAFDAGGAPRPAFRAVFQRFVDQWLGLSPLENLQKDASFPGFTAEVRASMRQETEAFVADVVFGKQGGLRELLTSPSTFVDATLAQYYGFGNGGPGQFVEAARPAGWGVGILAQGGVLSVNAHSGYTSPTQRGALVRERLLCWDPGPPPPVVGELPQPGVGKTTRDRYVELLYDNAACAGCHKMMDDIGFAFEHLDAAGKFREQENGLPIDAHGSIIALGTSEITFDGPTELATKLADQPETGECVAAFAAAYTYGLDHRDTSCLVSDLGQGLAAGDVSLVDFWLGLVSTTHFVRRVD